MAEAGAVTVPGYEVSGVLGQGGFGIVYRARQLAVEREVALKVDNRVLVSERDRRRFMREVTSAGALSGHPHVAHVYDAGVLPDGRPYMVLELCPGGSLLDRMRAEGRLAPAEVADIGARIADALSAAHAAGVLHRDIKPANILINRYGNVVLSDFGLATMPSAGGEVSVTRESLTPAYAPPEAFELTEPTTAGDVYSLAATLYALLSGRPPRFPESGVANIAVIMALHRLPVPEIPDVPAEFTEVLRQAMASDPARRTPSVAALRDALTDLRLDRAAQASRPAAPRPVPSVPSVPAAPPAAPLTGPPSPYGMPPARSAGAVGAAGRDPVRAHLTSPGARDLATTGARAAGAPSPGTSNSRVFVAVAVAFTILLLAGAGVMFLENRDREPPAGQRQDTAGEIGKPGTGTEAGKVDTVTAACPAAGVPGAQAACVKEAECWGGLVVISGDATAKRIGCEESHSWETFAIAPLPVDSLTHDYAALEKHPVVKKVCASQVLLASRYGDARAIGSGRWHSTVLPPSKEQFELGVRTYRCLGGVLGSEKPGTVFRP
ncbi:serine/threonine-protein kinase [Streptosporangium roseum]|uniref:non-specific serine/threonine protein kinase n=1 Tax=Streptosporangium roseum (strain ATCC 12428 / DSM 43021 / JCM 3005 / KCTC 9067 / NCIMB 10171 / NRRL 2505 / NI 9100) TaxID=479432 RepID=D2AV08_STRRD|nr:serine/threonine-protein kinase [Streptosporangium roseum]ACZ86870.1 Serine/threonine protein kinase-like protein [Streptosporangium roseum DSM 43021]